MAYRLRYGQHDLELRIGQFVIERAPSCQLVLDDPMVSRQHALLAVAADSVSVEDLGSRNGVLVNGSRITGKHLLGPGDRIKIGSQEMSVLGDGAPRSEATRAAPTQRLPAFGVLGGLAEKAIALGHVDEAERLLAPALGDLLRRAKGGDPPDLENCERAAAYATRLAGASGRGQWIDYAIDMFATLRRPLPTETIDVLHDVLRKVDGIDLSLLRAYVSTLQALESSFGPTERFLVSRIEGFERMASSR